MPPVCRPFAALAIASLSMSLPVPAPAQSQGYLPTAEDVIAVARRYGLASEAEPGEDGQRYVDGETDDGLFYGVLLYGCGSDPFCDALEFFATFSGVEDEGDYALVNEWNMTNRYGTAYRDEDGTVGVFMSVNLDFGVTRANFEDSFDIWQVVLGDFAEHVYVDDTTGVPSRPAK